MPRSAHPPHGLLPLRWILAAGLVALSACYADGPFSVAQARRRHLEIGVQPAEARVGSALGVQPVIEVRDQSGRLMKEAIPVTASLSSGDGKVLGTVTVTAQQGVARFTDLRLSGDYGFKTITFTAPGLLDVRASAVALRPPLRSRDDRVDDAAGPQVHVIYVLPQGAPDRRFDTELDIANSVAAFQGWLSRASGLQIRFDRYEGVLDVSFFELSRSDSAMRSLGPYIVLEIESELATAGLIRLDKRYLVYYDGGSASVCGGAAWPPSVIGQTAAVYLRACAPGSLAAQPNAAPGYWEFAALHDLIHTLGVVSPGAPHHTSGSPAHVPEPNDLMYGGGTAPWEPTTLDVNNDDYFAPSLDNGLANLAENPFVERVAAPPATAAVLSPVGRPFISTRLPAHQPLK
jgi:hypothetical protein